MHTRVVPGLEMAIGSAELQRELRWAMAAASASRLVAPETGDWTRHADACSHADEPERTSLAVSTSTQLVQVDRLHKREHLCAAAANGGRPPS